jgi:hypothetical protein
VEEMFRIDMEFAALFLEAFTFKRFLSLVLEYLNARSDRTPALSIVPPFSDTEIG